jgi:hypothetical protein
MPIVASNHALRVELELSVSSETAAIASPRLGTSIELF